MKTSWDPSHFLGSSPARWRSRSLFVFAFAWAIHPALAAEQPPKTSVVIHQMGLPAGTLRVGTGLSPKKFTIQRQLSEASKPAPEPSISPSPRLDSACSAVALIESQESERGEFVGVGLGRVVCEPDQVFLQVTHLIGDQSVRPGDRLTQLNLSEYDGTYPGKLEHLVQETGKSGFFGLKSGERVSARYRPLTYWGGFLGETASNLKQFEAILSILGKASFAVTDWMTLSTQVWIEWITPNLGVKLRLVDRPEIVMALELNTLLMPDRLLIQPEPGGVKPYFSASLLLDMPSNSKLVSHFKLLVGSAQFGLKEGDWLLPSLKLEYGYQYLMSHWARIFFGPNFEVNQRRFGLRLAYLQIWDRFHLMPYVELQNVLDFRVSQGNFFGLDAYWRL
jgi:hypothetical protein